MKPNILFILIDGGRADKILTDLEDVKLPNIKKLMNQGISFTNCFTSVDGTTMSLNCIFNSLYPTKTGLRAKKVVLTENNFLSQLKNNGYEVFGHIPNVSSFNSILEIFQNMNKTYYAGPPVKHISETKNEILELLNSIKGKTPWFCFLHLLDISALRQEKPPYGISEFYDNRFETSPYEKMLASIDSGIGEILDKINLNETVIVVTSDHGSLIPFENKGFTDFEPSFEKELKVGKKFMPKSTHKIGGKIFSSTRNLVRTYRLKKASGELSWSEQRSRFPYFKQSLYDEIIHVPLIISGPRIIKKQISELMSNMDIFPTIFELIGIDNIKKQIDGRSFKPLIDDLELDEKPIYLHTMPHEKIEDDDLEGIRTKKWKFLRSANESTKNQHLYDIEFDKFENKNVIQTLPKIAQKLEKQIEDIKLSSCEESENISDEETKKIEDELKRLGYM
jgi:arylsulfatase A-like enzyme